jgi:hypothetical protein
MKQISRFSALAALTYFVFLTGCGSMTRHERHQFILVRSNPSGADIYYHGEKVGKTPAFVEVRRSKLDSIQLMDEQRVVNLPIESRYRWDGSFWTNLVFFYFAPVGWGVDFITGSAWNMNDPQIPKLHMPEQPPQKTFAAIAPPEAYSADISDEGGLVWQRYLRARYPDLTILPYREKVDEFTTHGYDFDSKPGKKSEHEIFGRLGVSDVFESEFKDTDNGIELSGRFRNVFSGKQGPVETIKAQPTQEDDTWVERFKSYIHLIPNTIGYEFSKSDVQLTDASGTHHSTTTHDNTFWGQLMPYLGSINITSQILPRRESSGKFRFEFVPTLRASYRRLEFPSLDSIEGNEFSYLTIGVGIGPEIGWQWGPNYIYLNYIPIYGWHRLAWKSNNDEIKVSSIGEFTLRGEAGYLYYLTDRFSARAYIKSTTTPSRIWNTAIQDLAPGSPSVSSSTDVNFGLLFGYTWEPRREISKWKIFKRE